MRVLERDVREPRLVSWNAYAPILVRFPGKFISVSFMASAKAHEPIVSTEFGMDTEYKEVF